MAKITEYDAKDVKLDPSNTGYSAVEMAARRIGPLYEQMAAGSREVGNLTRNLDDETGKAITGFLRLKGLEDATNDINVKLVGGNANTLTGTGTNSGRTRNFPDFDQLREMHGGPALMSSAARNAISRANNETPDQRAARLAQQALDKAHDAAYDKLEKPDTSNSYGPSGDPFKEMQDIYKEANDRTNGPDANGNYPGSAGNQPNYAGPGASFGPGYQNPYSASDNGMSPPGPESNTGTTDPETTNVDQGTLPPPTPVSPSAPGLWGDLMNGFGFNNGN